MSARDYRDKTRVEEDLDLMWLELQIMEDTCKEHDVFCCDECFDMTDHDGNKKEKP